MLPAQIEAQAKPPASPRRWSPSTRPGARTGSASSARTSGWKPPAPDGRLGRGGDPDHRDLLRRPDELEHPRRHGMRRSSGSCATWPEITTINLHLHNARGMAPISAYVAMKELDERHRLIVDTAIGGIGGCPYCGNGRLSKMIPTEDFVHMLEGEGIRTGVDLASLIECVVMAEGIVGHELWGHVSQAGPRPVRRGRSTRWTCRSWRPSSEAQHFRLGPESYAGCLAPWKQDITVRGARRVRGPPRRARRSAWPLTSAAAGSSLAGLRVVEIGTSVAAPVRRPDPRRPRRRGHQGRAPRYRRRRAAVAAPGMGGPLDRLPVLQPQQEVSGPGLQDRRGQAGAGGPDRLGRRAGPEPAPGRSGQGRLHMGAPAGAEPAADLLRDVRLRAHRPRAGQPAYDPMVQAYSRHRVHHRRRGRRPGPGAVSLLDMGTGCGP